MNILELSQMVSKETGKSVKETQKTLAIAFKIIRKEILRAQIIKLQGLLTMFIDVIPERKRYDINSGETHIQPRKFVLKTFISKKLKEEINAKKTY